MLKRTYPINFNEEKFRWFGIPLLSLFLVLVVNNKPDCVFPSFWSNLLVTLVFTFCIWNSNYLIVKKFRRRLPLLNQTRRRIVRTFLITCLNTIAICIILDFAFFNIFSMPGDYGLHTDSMFTGLMASAFVLSVYEGLYFFEMWRQAMLSAEELKKANLQIQFDSLKNQVNPHFLFNSLNTLSSLVEEDSARAVRFIQKMSSVYRYLLQGSDRELATVAQELEFINAYVFMLKTRFDDSFSIEINVADKYQMHLLPPHTLQMLVENAVKHNVVSSDNPLSVNIYTDDSGYLIVSNNLQRKNALVKSNGVGLNNIIQRYELLGDRKVIVTEAEEKFTVKVPMLQEK
jgi:two-component system, LytTR family, sensor kinase